MAWAKDPPNTPSPHDRKYRDYNHPYTQRFNGAPIATHYPYAQRFNAPALDPHYAHPIAHPHYAQSNQYSMHRPTQLDINIHSINTPVNHKSSSQAPNESSAMTTSEMNQKGTVSVTDLQIYIKIIAHVYNSG